MHEQAVAREFASVHLSSTVVRASTDWAALRQPLPSSEFLLLPAAKRAEEHDGTRDTRVVGAREERRSRCESPHASVVRLGRLSSHPRFGQRKKRARWVCVLRTWAMRTAPRPPHPRVRTSSTSPPATGPTSPPHAANPLASHLTPRPPGLHPTAKHKAIGFLVGICRSPTIARPTTRPRTHLDPPTTQPPRCVINHPTTPRSPGQQPENPPLVHQQRVTKVDHEAPAGHTVLGAAAAAVGRGNPPMGRLLAGCATRWTAQAQPPSAGRGRGWAGAGAGNGEVPQ